MCFKVSKDELKLPEKYSKFEPPWANPKARVYKSEALLYNWKWIKENNIRGLKTTKKNFNVSFLIEILVTCNFRYSINF